MIVIVTPTNTRTPMHKHAPRCTGAFLVASRSVNYDPHGLMMRAVARLLILSLQTLQAHHAVLLAQLQQPLSGLLSGGDAQPLLTAVLKLSGMIVFGLLGPLTAQYCCQVPVKLLVSCLHACVGSTCTRYLKGLFTTHHTTPHKRTHSTRGVAMSTRSASCSVCHRPAGRQGGDASTGGPPAGHLSARGSPGTPTHSRAAGGPCTLYSVPTGTAGTASTLHALGV